MGFKVKVIMRRVNFTQTTNSRLEFFLLLLMMLPSLSAECPPRCQCSLKRVYCRNAGLKEVPRGMPSAVIEINLSDNPLLPIEKDSFMHFPKLHSLILKNVSQKGPIHLPNSLTWFAFGKNLISIDILKEMFRSPLYSLRKLELQDNNLNLTGLFPILPKGIKELILSGNNLLSLKQGDLDCCRELSEFHCEYCSLKSIEPKAFDNTRKLSTLKLSVNGLVDLPERIFERLPRLRTLELRGNHFQHFNTSKVNLKYLRYLGLGHNRLRAVDLQETFVLNIGLENNEIRRIDASMFKNSHYIRQLSLQNNRITEVSPIAFWNIKFLAALLLQGNNISMMSGKLFRKTRISTLCLHNNTLASVDALILGMKRPLSLFTLFSNKKLKHIDLSIFKSMHKRSRVLLSCSNLKSFTLTSKVSAMIHCCPSADLVIATPMRFLKFDGYECKWNSTHGHFACHACPVGFYLAVTNQFKCTPCPPGSFYQDGLASLSCKNCPIGQYVSPLRSPGIDASDCRTCPKGTNTTRSAGTRACYCLDGFYRSYRFGACERCKHHGFECMRDYPQLRWGFWMTWNGTGSLNHTCKRDFKAFIFNLETHNNDYDRNTMHFNCQLPLPVKCPKLNSCLGGIDSNCSSGYSGVLCGACSIRYTSHFNQCIKCPQIYVVVLRFVLCIALFLLLCYIVSGKQHTAKKTHQRIQHSADAVDRTLADVVISSFKIAIGFYQTLIGVMHTYRNINWPNNLLKMFSVLDFIQFQIIQTQSMRCITSKWAVNSIEEFWLAMLSSLAFLLLCFLYFLAKSCYLHFHDGSSLDFRRKKSLCATNCVKIVAFFLFVTYPYTLTKIIHVLPISCRSICTVRNRGICLHSLSFLRSDYSVACPTMSSHEYTLSSAYCSLVLLVGLPFGLWILLRKRFPKDHCVSFKPYIRPMETIRVLEAEDSCSQRETVDPDAVSRLTTEDSTTDTVSVWVCALKFTYENYKEKYWFWEVMEMVRKLMMTTCAGLFLYQTKIGLSGVITLGMVFAVLHAVHKPMKDGFENFLQILSLFIVPINLSVGAVIQSRSAQSNKSIKIDSEPWKLGLFLIVINSLIMILILARFVKYAIERVTARLLLR